MLIALGVRLLYSPPINKDMKGVINRIIAIFWWFYTIPRRYDQERRNSLKYKKKKKIVRNVWIITGVIMTIAAQFPELFGLVIVIALAAMGLSFIILDETE